MKLKLEKDVIVLDLETTGLSTAESRIIQIALLKVFADGRPNEMKVKYINPEIPIPEVVTEITGITDEMVQTQPTFKQLAKGVLTFIGDADLVGFNSNRFDIPILMESFVRVGLELDMTSRKVVDVKRIYHRMEPRDLKAAHKFYVGSEMSGAHDAGNDVNATLNVLEAMIDKYQNADYVDKHDEVIEKPIQNDIDALYKFTKDQNEVDFIGTMIYDENNVPIFNFGKYQGLPVAESMVKDPKYYDWIMNKGQFMSETRKTLSRIVTEYKKQTSEKDAFHHA